jgi:hypothetical protein
MHGINGFGIWKKENLAFPKLGLKKVQRCLKQYF